jgi:serine/threonine protein kinase
MNKLTLNNGCGEFKSFLENIDTYFAQNTQTIHKARNELKVIPFNDINTIVKSFKVPNILNKIIYSFLRDSKAKRSYEYSLRISKFVPKAIGYIEFYESGLLNNSYFISEKFEYTYTIREALKKKLNKTEDEYNKIYRAFAKFTYELHEDNIFHHDYSPGNILIKDTDDGLEFKIVDINRMSFSTLDESKRAQNFEKLWALDEILEVMADEYTNHYHALNTDEFKKNVLYFSNKNKKIKNFKKRIKGKPVTD